MIFFLWPSSSFSRPPWTVWVGFWRVQVATYGPENGQPARRRRSRSPDSRPIRQQRLWPGFSYLFPVDRARFLFRPPSLPVGGFPFSTFPRRIVAFDFFRWQPSSTSIFSFNSLDESDQNLVGVTEIQLLFNRFVCLPKLKGVFLHFFLDLLPNYFLIHRNSRLESVCLAYFLVGRFYFLVCGFYCWPIFPINWVSCHEIVWFSGPFHGQPLAVCRFIDTTFTLFGSWIIFVDFRSSTKVSFGLRRGESEVGDLVWTEFFFFPGQQNDWVILRERDWMVAITLRSQCYC